MNERIKQLRKALNLTQQEFADKIMVKRNTVATYEMGRSEPSDSAFSLICREFNVNPDWLRTGEGEMFVQLTDQQKLMKYTAMILKGEDSVVVAAIQALIVTYEQLDPASKATLEKIALQYIENLKKSQFPGSL
ncbi:helix-turn-helix domain-containing protein [Hungatella hathewayi]|uniref:Helix-turn-helix domain-containing protein n=1 Tax=Hungatella hathewayi TaxID=154046 RepID=A0A3E2WH58_9FIRM|nr:helix-turn-helix transcriptional regulator [Hungatella hathewayi]RGC26105.1 helix-turn-helix domain-containing protein [Hungatella hathewayi]CAJ1761456.1 transcriptional regulator [uncultured phage]